MKNFLKVGLSQGYSAGATLLIMWLLTKNLSPENYGGLSVLLAFHAFIIIFFKCLNPATLKILSENGKNAPSIVLEGRIKVTIIQVIMSFLILWLLYFNGYYNELSLDLFILVIILSIGFNLEQFLLQDAQVKTFFGKYSLLQIGSKTIRLLGVLILINLELMSLTNIMLVYIFSQLSLLFIHSPFGDYSMKWKHWTDWFKFSYVRYSIWMFLIEIFNVMGQRAHYVIGLDSLDLKSVGQFGLAENLALFLTLVPSVILAVLSPKIYAANKKENKQLLSLLWKFHGLYLIVCIIAFLTIPWFIEYFFEVVFHQAASVFKWLIFGVFLTMCSSSYFPFFHKHEKYKSVILIEFTCTLSYILMLYFLQLDMIKIAQLWTISKFIQLILAHILFIKQTR